MMPGRSAVFGAHFTFSLEHITGRMASGVPINTPEANDGSHFKFLAVSGIPLNKIQRPMVPPKKPTPRAASNPIHVFPSFAGRFDSLSVSGVYPELTLDEAPSEME